MIEAAKTDIISDRAPDEKDVVQGEVRSTPGNQKPIQRCQARSTNTTARSSGFGLRLIRDAQPTARSETDSTAIETGD